MGSGRFRRQKSYGHRILLLGTDSYRISWVMDRYYGHSRLRYPTDYARVTDGAGAMRFAKRHDIRMEED